MLLLGSALLGSALLGSVPERSAAQDAPPDSDWRMMETRHFRVTFPRGLEELAGRAAVLAEEARSDLEREFLPAPEGIVDILLTDHTDYANGFARYFPSNRITIYARPPVDLPGLGYYDDWLRLVIIHELAHVVHLDRTGTAIGRAARRVFGRVAAPWPFFPGTALPRWAIEGLATWYESELTGTGRVHGTFHEAVVRTAALEGRFEGIGQVQGTSPAWPAGGRPYSYGSLFFDHLLDLYGEEGMAAFAEAVAGQWVPYRLDAAGRKAFGVSFSEAWSDWADAVLAGAEEFRQAALDFGPISETESVTSGARQALRPVVAPDGSALFYSVADGRSDPALARLAPGRDEQRLTRLNGDGSFAVLPSGDLLFAQLDYRDSYRVFGDLYLHLTATGEERRITRGERLSQPSATPDGNAVAVRDGAGARSLVRVEIANGAVGQLVPASPDEHWAFPAVSPDGEWIAATRWRRGARHDIVVVDGDGRLAAEVTSDRAMDLAPRWSADGRHLVWMSDRNGTFNIVGATWDAQRAAAGEVRLLTNLLTAAGYPALDASGDWLYFSAYHADGWEIERLPFDYDSATPVPGPRRAAVAERSGEAPSPSPPLEQRSYSALSTLAPTYWEPTWRAPVATAAVNTASRKIPSRRLLGHALGLSTGGYDLVGRHSYSASLRAFLPEGEWEGGASYGFRGFGNPVLGLSATQHWDDDGARLALREAGAPPDTLFVLERERRVAASINLFKRRWRSYLSLVVEAGLVRDDFTLLDSELDPATRYELVRPTTRLFDYSTTLYWSNARSSAMQMGAYKGSSFLLRLRERSELALPDSLAGEAWADRSVQDAVVRMAGYFPLFRAGYAQHLVALRLSAGAARGSGAHAGYFGAGGTAGSPELLTGLSLFGGRSILFPVRGYGTGSRGGTKAWSASLEYRFPLFLVNRGLGAWPGHLDRVSGSIYFDAGDAWSREPDDRPASEETGRPLTSVGGEVAADFLAFYRFGLRLRAGVAFPLREAASGAFYLRLGLPF